MVLAADVRYCLACGGQMRLPAAPRAVPECTLCGRLHHLDPQVGVGAVVRDDAGRLLLVRRGVEPGLGRWALPAGYVDADEDPREAAAREVLEETGLVVRCHAVVDVYPGTGTGTGASFFLAFHADLLGGELAAADDALDARFFGPHELPDLAFPSTVDAAARLLA